MKNTIGKLALATGLVLLVGCGEEDPALPKGLNKEYSGASSVEKREQSLEMMSGRILEVQPSSVSFGRGHGSANHPFSYLIVKGKDGAEKILIYPYSKAIPTGRDVTFNYRFVSPGVSSGTFVKSFVDPYSVASEDFFIEADGIIIKGGIVFEGEKSKNPEPFILENGIIIKGGILENTGSSK
jgi:hypothetical protein